MTLQVRAPLAGIVVPLSQVPDAVFAGQLVGSGAAVEPTGSGAVTVVAPVGGTVAKLHPHAFVVLTDEQVGVLVHVGIDTVGLKGKGFTTHTDEGAHVEPGQDVITFDPAAVRAAGLSAVCPVVVLDSVPDSASAAPAGSLVTTADTLLSWAPHPSAAEGT